MKHEYYKSCGRDECDGSCPKCTLAICKVCGCAEAELTTDCPGRKVELSRRDLVVENLLDYRLGRWVKINRQEKL